METLKVTPLTNTHTELGAKLVPFAGFSMPVRYRNINDEHHTVRNNAGLFDLCHMGRITVSGNESTKFLQHVTTNNIAKMKEGQAHYALILNESGNILDDIIVYKRPHCYLVVCNGANLEKIDAWLNKHKERFNVTLSNDSDTVGMIAIQGKSAAEIITRMVDIDISTMKYYYCGECNICNIPGMIARTGYTGEDGFEIYVENDKLLEIWNASLEIGKEFGLTPIGLAARDTLRLEASMPLYGHEIDETTNPLEAGLKFGVKLQKEDFIGHKALLKIEEEGIKRKLVCIEIDSKRIARQDSKIVDGDKEVGYVTSGTMSPTLQKSIAMGYVAIESLESNNLNVLISDKPHKAQIVKSPFYKREK